MLIHILLIAFAYFLGSLSFAVVLCKTLGLEDPRLNGSNNPGATNVLRLYGKKLALATLFGDMLKGALPVIIGQLLHQPDMILAIIGLSAFMGHLFPIFFNFKGGKGVATLLGVLFSTAWPLGLAFIATWLIIILLLRYSSVSSLTAATLTPIYMMMTAVSPWFILSHTLMMVLLFWKHRTNLCNLINGTEKKIIR